MTKLQRDFLHLLPALKPFNGSLKTGENIKNFEPALLFAGYSILKKKSSLIDCTWPMWILSTPLAGGGRLVWNDQTRIIEVGTCYLIPAKLSFCEYANIGSDWHSLDVLFKCMPNGLSRLKRNVSFAKTSPEMVMDMINLAYTLYIKEMNYSLKAYGLYYLIVSEFLNALSGVNGESDLVKRSYGFMEAHIEEKITVRDMANYNKMGTSTFAIRFKKEAGISPITAFRQEKIKKAKMLLTIGKSVGETADLLGFKDQFYFSRMFHQIEGISPLQFKRLLHRKD